MLVLVAVLSRTARADDWQDRRCGLAFDASLGAGSVYHGPWGPLLSVLEPSNQVESFAALAVAVCRNKHYRYLPDSRSYS